MDKLSTIHIVMEKGVWENFLINYSQKNNSPILVSILKKTHLVSFLDNKALIACYNRGTKIYLDSHKKEIALAFSTLVGKPTILSFDLQEKKKLKQQKTNNISILEFEKNQQEVFKKSGLQKKFIFDNFAVSSSNHVAYAAAMAVSESLANKYNPLFLYGGVGVGKTHLTQAMGNKILEKNSNKKVLFCSSEDFVNDLIQGIRSKNTDLFRKKYRLLDLFLVDDVQFIAGKNYIQEEFFHNFNSIIRSGGQIVLTSDKHPKEIKKLEDRLASRFTGGLTIDVQPPDFELRTAILLLKAKERNININIEAAKLIAEKIHDTRELEGKLLEIYTKAIKQHNEIITTNILTQDVFKTKRETKNNLSPHDVIKLVCSFYKIKPYQIKDSTRKEKIAFPRQIIMFILRNTLKLKYEEIAFVLKRKDHTTIMHGVDKITELILKNPTFKDGVDRIINSLYL